MKRKKAYTAYMFIYNNFNVIIKRKSNKINNFIRVSYLPINKSFIPPSFLLFTDILTANNVAVFRIMCLDCCSSLFIVH